MDNIYNLSLKTKEANEHLGRSVKNINQDALITAVESQLKDNYFLGVKNTHNISREIIRKLCDKNEFVWHTIDTFSDRGRAIDVDLVNPINGRAMTGSSSGTALNVLYGINDLGIGTDGGGSVIYPAMSLNLYAFMGKGMGLLSSESKVSTDGIDFTPGVGFISHNLNLIRKALEKLDVLKKPKDKVRISAGSLADIESIDLREKINLLLAFHDIKSLELKFSDDRDELMNVLKDIFLSTDILVVYEKNIDVSEYGDSVMGTLGEEARENQKKSNKRVGKVANMLGLTAITIPDIRCSSGLIILAKEGTEYGSKALEIAETLAGDYMPDLYYRYFKNSYLMKRNEIIFSL